MQYERIEKEIEEIEKTDPERATRLMKAHRSLKRSDATATRKRRSMIEEGEQLSGVRYLSPEQLDEYVTRIQPPRDPLVPSIDPTYIDLPEGVVPEGCLINPDETHVHIKRKMLPKLYDDGDLFVVNVYGEGIEIKDETRPFLVYHWPSVFERRAARKAPEPVYAAPDLQSALVGVVYLRKDTFQLGLEPTPQLRACRHMFTGITDDGEQFLGKEVVGREVPLALCARCGDDYVYIEGEICDKCVGEVRAYNELVKQRRAILAKMAGEKSVYGLTDAEYEEIQVPKEIPEGFTEEEYVDLIVRRDLGIPRELPMSEEESFMSAKMTEEARRAAIQEPPDEGRRVPLLSEEPELRKPKRETGRKAKVVEHIEEEQARKQAASETDKAMGILKDLMPD